jgi:2-deoxy-D-gluconate 3-dehydrogenase
MGGILDAFKLDGKVAVVTGANRGIGRGIALGLAQAGADILGVSRDDSAPETRQLVEAAGGRYVHCAADLGDMASLARVVPAAREAYGRIDILVNNAGIIRRNDSLDFSEQDWDQVMDVNLKATFFLSRGRGQVFRRAGERRQDNQHRIDAELSGRHQGTLVYRQQERREGPDHAPGE